MQSPILLLTAYLTLIVSVNGTPTSKKTTSTSKAPTATPSSVATTYDINVSLLPSQAITSIPANRGQFDERTVNPVVLLNAVGTEDTIVRICTSFKHRASHVIQTRRRR